MKRKPLLPPAERFIELPIGVDFRKPDLLPCNHDEQYLALNVETDAFYCRLCGQEFDEDWGMQ